MAHTIFRGRVTDENQHPIQNAEIRLTSDQFSTSPASSGEPTSVPLAFSQADGSFELTAHHLEPGSTYTLTGSAFQVSQDRIATIGQHHTHHVDFQLTLGLEIRLAAYTDNSKIDPIERAVAGKRVSLTADSTIDTVQAQLGRFEWRLPERVQGAQFGKDLEVVFPQAGLFPFGAMFFDKSANASGAHASASLTKRIEVGPAELQMVGGSIQGEMRGDLNVRLHRATLEPTLDQALWVAIKNRTHAISFVEYKRYMDRVLYGADAEVKRPHELDIPLGVEAYKALKYLTEAFLLRQSGVFIGNNRSDGFVSHSDAWRAEMREKLREYLGEPPRLPYFQTVIDDALPWLERGTGTIHDQVLLDHIKKPPMIELIHTYWLEEGMLMQTINAVAQRFQNVHSRSDRDPLANFELDPLRRLTNWLWGFIQDEPNRLTVKRRAFEYLHQYGLPLYGKALHGMRPADNRSKFIEAFHNLLHESYVFFKQDDQTTILADAYPLLNALKEVHLILAQAAGNQFNDARWATRVESLLVQFILAQPPMRDFLQGRPMVPYQEPWMPQVDAMKTLQSWSDVTVTHFRNLAVYGEQILLAVRFGNWIDIQNADHAAHWAREFRPAIQSYISAYRAVTGVDLTTSEKIDAVPPAVHLQNRLAAQQRAR